MSLDGINLNKYTPTTPEKKELEDKKELETPIVEQKEADVKEEGVLQKVISAEKSAEKADSFSKKLFENVEQNVAEPAMKQVSDVVSEKMVAEGVGGSAEIKTESSSEFKTEGSSEGGKTEGASENGKTHKGTTEDTEKIEIKKIFIQAGKGALKASAIGGGAAALGVLLSKPETEREQKLKVLKGIQGAVQDVEKQNIDNLNKLAEEKHEVVKEMQSHIDRLMAISNKYSEVKPQDEQNLLQQTAEEIQGMMDTAIKLVTPQEQWQENTRKAGSEFADKLNNRIKTQTDQSKNDFDHRIKSTKGFIEEAEKDLKEHPVPTTLEAMGRAAVQQGSLNVAGELASGIAMAAVAMARQTQPGAVLSGVIIPLLAAGVMGCGETWVSNSATAVKGIDEQGRLEKDTIKANCVRVSNLMLGGLAPAAFLTFLPQWKWSAVVVAVMSQALVSMNFPVEPTEEEYKQLSKTCLQSCNDISMEPYRNEALALLRALAETNPDPEMRAELLAECDQIESEMRAKAGAMVKSREATLEEKGYAKDFIKFMGAIYISFWLSQMKEMNIEAKKSSEEAAIQEANKSKVQSIVRTQIDLDKIDQIKAEHTKNKIADAIKTNNMQRRALNKLKYNYTIIYSNNPAAFNSALVVIEEKRRLLNDQKIILRFSAEQMRLRESKSKPIDPHRLKEFKRNLIAQHKFAQIQQANELREYMDKTLKQTLKQFQKNAGVVNKYAQTHQAPAARPKAATLPPETGIPKKSDLVKPQPLATTPKTELATQSQHKYYQMNLAKTFTHEAKSAVVTAAKRNVPFAIATAGAATASVAATALMNYGLNKLAEYTNKKAA